MFVSDPKEVSSKDHKRVPVLQKVDIKDDDSENEEDEEDVFETRDKALIEVAAEKHKGEKDKYVMQLKKNLSENKGQYKRLADAIIKEEQFAKVE